MSLSMKIEADLPHITQDRDRHGNPRIYYRIEGRPMIRLRARPGTPEFFDEYQRAKDVTAAAATAKPLLETTAISTSLRWLVEQYYKSAWFKTLALSMQKARRGILDSICESTIPTPAGNRAYSRPFMPHQFRLGRRPPMTESHASAAD